MERINNKWCGNNQEICGKRMIHPFPHQHHPTTWSSDITRYSVSHGGHTSNPLQKSGRPPDDQQVIQISTPIYQNKFMQIDKL